MPQVQKGRPRKDNALTGAERSRRWRQRQRQQDREDLANIVAAIKNRNEKEIVLSTREEILDFLYQRKPGEY